MAGKNLRFVPRSVLIALVFALGMQVTLKSFAPPPRTAATDLPLLPSVSTLRLAAMGDAAPLARLLMLYLQAFDLHAGNQLPYRSLDYDRLIDWLGKIMELDPEGQYPLHAASRIYAEVPNAEKQRKMLDFVYRQFFADPDRRWPWLAQAAAVAKHQLRDLPVARRYAAAIQRYATAADVPIWARQMEAFILEDMDELETARVMIGGFVTSGQVRDPGELRFLDQRLKEIEARIAARKTLGR
jgi:hypothetical protein